MEKKVEAMQNQLHNNERTNLYNSIEKKTLQEELLKAVQQQEFKHDQMLMQMFRQQKQQDE